MAVKIKICGIRDAEMAEAVGKLGADYVGIVHYPQSIRHVEWRRLPELAEAACEGGAKPVLVCVDLAAELLCEASAWFSVIQLQGKPVQDCSHRLPAQVARIWALAVQDRVIPSTIDPERDYLLYDTPNPGSGQVWSLDTRLPDGKTRFFIAGGLHADNICERIWQFSPYGIDVSSGVEKEPGVKSLDKIKRLIEVVYEN